MVKRCLLLIGAFFCAIAASGTASKFDAGGVSVDLSKCQTEQAAPQGESAVITAEGKRKRAGHRERFWRRNSTIAGMASTMESRHSS